MSFALCFSYFELESQLTFAAQGQILDSKEFYAPIITPLEAQMAFNSEGSIPLDKYRLDFDSLLDPDRAASEVEEGMH